MSDDFSVTDRHCEATGQRTHELINPETQRVQRFKFEPGKATDCPRWAAMRFAAIDGFDVRDGDDNQFRVNAEDQEPLRALAPDETIARFEELTQDALLARCLALDAKCGFNKAAKKGEMVAFLIKTAAPEESDEAELVAELDEQV